MNWLETARLTNPTPVPPAIPERFADATLDPIPSREIRKLVTDYLSQFWDVAPKGIAPVLLGRTGQWKTHAAAVMARAIGKSVETIWVTCPVDIPRLELDRFSKETQYTIDRWCSVPFLVMDDFAIQAKGWSADVLRMVSASRFAALRPTLWTGNVLLEGEKPWEKIAVVYGAMFARRLKDGSKLDESTPGFLVICG